MKPEWTEVCFEGKIEHERFTIPNVLYPMLGFTLHINL